MEKTLCPIHRYMYSGMVCPFCQQDKLSKFTHKQHKEESNKPVHKDLTMDDLVMLKNHFENK